MRRFLALLCVAVLGSAGCKHVGGKCDCGLQPGEAALYAPMKNYGPVNAEPIASPKELPKK